MRLDDDTRKRTEALLELYRERQRRERAERRVRELTEELRLLKERRTESDVAREKLLKRLPRNISVVEF